MINHVYIIAEAGVNHNGRLDLALQLCNAAKDAGADAVKFQTWKTEKIVTRNAELAVYQENNISDKTKSQFKMLKELELSYDNFEVVKNHCDEIGIQFLSTPDEIDSLDFLCNFNLPFIKLGSGDVTNIPFLRLVGSRHIDVVLSTGMSYLGDVEIAYRTLIEAGAKSVSLLHCTTNYPCPMHEVNLRAIQTLKDAFHCSVGYSDHTMGVEVPVAAVAMGAEIIEKHFTLDKEMDGPDHKASLSRCSRREVYSGLRSPGDLRNLSEESRGSRRYRILHVWSWPDVESCREDARRSRCSGSELDVRQLRRIRHTLKLVNDFDIFENSCKATAEQEFFY